MTNLIFFFIYFSLFSYFFFFSCFTLFLSFLFCFFSSLFFFFFLSLSVLISQAIPGVLGHQLRHQRACIKRMHLGVHPRSIILLPMGVYFRPVYRYFHPHGEYSRRLVLTSVKPTGYLTGRYLRKADIKYIHSCG